MWGLIALIGGMLNGVSHSVLSFYQPIKSSNWYYFISVPLLIGFTFGWLFIAKNIPMKEEVYRLGAIWDSAIVLTWYLGSIWLFGLKFTPLTWIGIGVMVLGVVIIKVAEVYSV
jgi:multidrug transporter EmrE-like cation transporter